MRPPPTWSTPGDIPQTSLPSTLYPLPFIEGRMDYKVMEIESNGGGGGDLGPNP